MCMSTRYPSPLDVEDDPRRWSGGIGQSGRVLDRSLVFDGGGGLPIHAMKARAQFLDESSCSLRRLPVVATGMVNEFVTRHR